MRIGCPRAVLLLGLALPGAVTACSGAAPTHTATLRQDEPAPAVLAFYGDTSLVQLPPSVRVGERVTVRFSTYGGSCVRPGTVEVVVSGLRAEVRPYLEKPPVQLPDTMVCTAELRVDWREAQMHFDRPGRAEIRIVGLALPEDRPFMLVRDLQVTS